MGNSLGLKTSFLCSRSGFLYVHLTCALLCKEPAVNVFEQRELWEQGKGTAHNSTAFGNSMKRFSVPDVWFFFHTEAEKKEL